jgi:hypothetical protein
LRQYIKSHPDWLLYYLGCLSKSLLIGLINA